VCHTVLSAGSRLSTVHPRCRCCDCMALMLGARAARRQSRAEGAEPSRAAGSDLIIALCKASQPGAALRVFEDMTAAESAWGAGRPSPGHSPERIGRPGPARQAAGAPPLAGAADAACAESAPAPEGRSAGDGGRRRAPVVDRVSGPRAVAAAARVAHAGGGAGAAGEAAPLLERPRPAPSQPLGAAGPGEPEAESAAAAAAAAAAAGAPGASPVRLPSRPRRRRSARQPRGLAQGLPVKQRRAALAARVQRPGPAARRRRRCSPGAGARRPARAPAARGTAPTRRTRCRSAGAAPRWRAARSCRTCPPSARWCTALPVRATWPPPSGCTSRRGPPAVRPGAQARAVPRTACRPSVGGRCPPLVCVLWCTGTGLCFGGLQQGGQRTRLQRQMLCVVESA